MVHHVCFCPPPSVKAIIIIPAQLAYHHMAEILIVDDAKIMLDIVRGMLEGSGHEVIGAVTSGKEALEAYQKHRPDIVFLDINMPEINGLETLREMKLIDPDVRIIIISASRQHYDNAMNLGATSYLLKPFTRSDILREIRNSLENNT